MTDEMATAMALGGRFEREDCGFFEQCSHQVEKYDMTVPGGSITTIFYCSIDWYKVGPVLAFIMFMLFLVYRRYRRNKAMEAGDYSSSSRHRDRHHRRR